jgi:hypothetical protein
LSSLSRGPPFFAAQAVNEKKQRSPFLYELIEFLGIEADGFKLKLSGIGSLLIALPPIRDGLEVGSHPVEIIE